MVHELTFKVIVMSKKIAIIGGGNLGASMAEGLVSSGFVSADQLMVTKRNTATLANLEAKGVIICRYILQNENIEAFSFWSGDRPFIFLASDKKSAARARFDVAHELFHLCAHRWVGADELDDEDRLKQIESEADHFAGAFLLPKRTFPNEVYSSRAESFIDLKARWKVSIQAMAYRCKDLGLFDDRQMTNIYKQISFKKWRTDEPLDKGMNAIPFEEPILLRKVAEAVLQSGRYNVDKLRADLALSDGFLEQVLGISLGENVSQIEPFIPTLK